MFLIITYYGNGHFILIDEVFPTRKKARAFARRYITAVHKIFKW